VRAPPAPVTWAVVQLSLKNVTLSPTPAFPTASFCLSPGKVAWKDFSRAPGHGEGSGDSAPQTPAEGLESAPTSVSL
jgi:hypothetical protein